MASYFMPPIAGHHHYLVQELRGRRHMRGAEHRGGTDGTNGGYTIGGVVYYGGHWNGPLTATQITAITNAGHGARIYAVDDLNDLPANIDGP